jgi:hypothetical protein
MKTIVGILGIAGLLSLASCDRDWSCQCTDQSGNMKSIPINNTTLLNARNKCKDMNYNYTAGGTEYSESCSLQ